MIVLYIFPHPDDESFGPAPAISSMVRAGHDVHLLTLTKGGATKVRHNLNLSIEEMGEVRYKEMLEVQKVLGLTSMKVLDFPDSNLKEVDPRELEGAVKQTIQEVKPALIVTYPVHGVSGFADHLVAHAVVKRAYVELKSNGADYLQRLAFFTLEASNVPADATNRLRVSLPEDIDCKIPVDETDIANFQAALDCYVTYQEIINQTGVRNAIRHSVAFEIFGESHDPPLKCLLSDLASETN